MIEIIDHGFTKAHLDVIAATSLLVVAAWRHATLKPGDVVEVTGGHRGVFLKEVGRAEYEARIRSVGATEWLDAPINAHFWEVAWD